MIYLICQDWSNTSNNHAGINTYATKFRRCILKAIKPSLFLPFGMTGQNPPFES